MSVPWQTKVEPTRPVGEIAVVVRGRYVVLEVPPFTVLVLRSDTARRLVEYLSRAVELAESGVVGF